MSRSDGKTGQERFIFSLKSGEHLIFGCLQFSDRCGKVVNKNLTADTLGLEKFLTGVNMLAQ